MVAGGNNGLRQRSKQSGDGSETSVYNSQLAAGLTHSVDEANMYIEDEVLQFTQGLHNRRTLEEGSALRQAVARVMLSETMEMAIAFIIFFNCIIIAFETDQEAQCYPEFYDDVRSCPSSYGQYTWIMVANNVLLGIYTLEAVLMIYVLRLEYFRHPSYWFDFLIMLGGWASVVFARFMRVSYFRILRCGRLFKAFHFVTNIPELYMLFTGFFGSMKAMFFGSLILGMLLVFSSILLVQLVHPENSMIKYERCERCSSGFASIGDSVLTLFQNIVAGDSWGQISIPVIMRNPIGLLLPLAQIVIGIGAMNLILAVVVDSAQEARETKNEQGLKLKAGKLRKRKKELLSYVEQMDTNRDGTVDRSEVMNAAKQSPDFVERLKFMGITYEDLEQIIDATENAESGNISYMEFCNALDAVEAGDTRKTVVLLKMNLSCLRRDILAKFEQQELVLTDIRNQLAKHNGGNAFECPSEFQGRGTTALEEALNSSETCPACQSVMSSVAPQIACQTSLLQRSLYELDAFWSNAVGLAEQASAFCSKDNESPPQVGTERKKPPFCKPLANYVVEQLGQTKYVVEKLSETQRNSLLRQSKLFQGVVQDLENEVASLIKHCKVFSAHDIRSEECSPRPTDPRALPDIPRGQGASSTGGVNPSTTSIGVFSRELVTL